MCGVLLEIDPGDHGKHQACEVCRRQFKIQFTQDVATQQKGVSLLFLTEGNRKNGATRTVGSGTTSFQLPSARSSTATHGLLREPELPDEAHFRCSCKVLLAISKARFEKRSRCPVCGIRMLIFMLYDSATGSFNLQTFSLMDKTSGTTQVLTRL